MATERDPRTMSFAALVREYYHGDPMRRPAGTDALREEIREHVKWGEHWMPPFPSYTK